MQVTTLFDNLPIWGVFVSIIVTIMIGVEGGYRLGKLRRQHPEGGKETSVGAMAGATLGLLSFILGFTFGLASSRFDARRVAVLDESSEITTAYLRAGLAPEPHRTEMRKLLSEYADIRLSAIQTGNIEQGIRRSKELQRMLWAHPEALIKQKDVPVNLITHIGQGLTGVFDLDAKRVMLGRHRISGVIWVALYLVSILAMGVMGYHAGVTGSSRTWAIFAMALAYSLVIGLIADLDRPHAGLLTVSQQETAEVRDMMLEMKP